LTFSELRGSNERKEAHQNFAVNYKNSIFFFFFILSDALWIYLFIYFKIIEKSEIEPWS